MMARGSLTRFSSTFLILFAFFFSSSLLLVGCVRGDTVTKEAPSFVDKTAAGGFDKESPVGQPITGAPELQVVNTTDDAFVAPPGFVQNATITIDEKKVFVGHDAVKVWVTNTRGTQSFLIPEGSSVHSDRLGITMVPEKILHANGGEVFFSLNGASVPALGNRQEVKVNGVYVFVSDLFLNGPADT